MQTPLHLPAPPSVLPHALVPIPRRPEDPRRSVRLRRQIWHTLYERRNHDSETPQEVAVVGPDTTRLRHEETGVVAAFRESQPETGPGPLSVPRPGPSNLPSARLQVGLPATPSYRFRMIFLNAIPGALVIAFDGEKHDAGSTWHSLNQKRHPLMFNTMHAAS